MSKDEPLDDEATDTYRDVAFEPTFPTTEQEYIHKETITELHEALRVSVTENNDTCSIGMDSRMTESIQGLNPVSTSISWRAM